MNSNYLRFFITNHFPNLGCPDCLGLDLGFPNLAVGLVDYPNLAVDWDLDFPNPVAGLDLDFPNLVVVVLDSNHFAVVLDSIHFVVVLGFPILDLALDFPSLVEVLAVLDSNHFVVVLDFPSFVAVLDSILDFLGFLPWVVLGILKRVGHVLHFFLY